MEHVPETLTKIDKINPVNVATLVFKNFLKNATKEQLIDLAERSYKITMENAKKYQEEREKSKETYERFFKDL